MSSCAHGVSMILFPGQPTSGHIARSRRGSIKPSAAALRRVRPRKFCFPRLRERHMQSRESFPDVRERFSDVRERFSDVREGFAAVRQDSADVRGALAEARESFAEVRPPRPDLREKLPEAGPPPADVRESVADVRQRTPEDRRRRSRGTAPRKDPPLCRTAMTLGSSRWSSVMPTACRRMLTAAAALRTAR